MSHEKAENRQIDFKGKISTHCFLTNVYAFEKNKYFSNIWYVQGQRRLSVQSKLALTERNMYADIFLKVVLKSWDSDIFGTTTLFYEMHTVRPLFDQMSVTLGFKNKFLVFIWISSKFCLFFLMILSLYDSISVWNDSWLDKTNILLGFCTNSASVCNTSEK
jgi:hypothetical protein